MTRVVDRGVVTDYPTTYQKYVTPKTGSINRLQQDIDTAPVVIQGVTATNGILTAKPKSGFAFTAGQWYRTVPTAKAVPVAISGATALTYTQVAADIGAILSFLPTNPTKI